MTLMPMTHVPETGTENPYQKPGTSFLVPVFWGHIKNIHLHSCKHKTVKLKPALTLTLTLTDTGGAVLTLMLGYRRLRIYKLKYKIQN